MKYVPNANRVMIFLTLLGIIGLYVQSPAEWKAWVKTHSHLPSLQWGSSPAQIP